ncbi:MAG: hypothetical protein ACO2PP_04870 [Thermocrinis sp.]|uniref:hypothetical protein n=1 Tax=Thermocrinis sp. TaxID=2024383 RepID=UPI003C10CDF3
MVSFRVSLSFGIGGFISYIKSAQPSGTLPLSLSHTVREITPNRKNGLTPAGRGGGSPKI